MKTPAEIKTALADFFEPTEVKVKYKKRRRDPVVRFWALVAKSPEPDGCWNFTGAKVSRKGHRSFVLFTGHKVLAHRYSWFLAHGDPGGNCVLHHCDNPACVRPDHLFLGTRADNNADMDAKGRRVPHRGEKNSWAKADEATVLLIRRLYAAGVSRQELSRQFQLSLSGIVGIVMRQTWKHLPEEVAS